MTKTLKDFMEVYRPKSPDEQKFVDKHVTIKHKDRNGNGDDVFNASKIKTIKRKGERHGYDSGEDEKVYEEVEDLDELSQMKVRAYRDKARDDKESAEDEREFYKAHDDNTDDEDNKIRKRTAGIKMAGKKIHGGAKVPVKEDAELAEKKLTPAEMKKREEVAKAIGRENPNMPMPQKMAIATATAKKVAESSDAYGQSMDTEKKKMITPSDKDKISRLAAMLKAEKKPMKEEAIDEAMHPHDAHFKKQTPQVQNSLNTMLRRGHSYPEAVKKVAGATPLKEEVQDLEEKISDEAKAVIRKTINATGAKAKPLVKLAQMGKKTPIKPMDEAIGDITVKSKSSADAYAQHTGQVKKKTSVPKDPKTGKTLYQKVTSEEAEQMDEISKPALGRYINKAKDHIDTAAWRQGYREAGGGSSSDRLERKLSKRHKGIETAVKKLTKEDVEQIDELSKQTMKMYHAKASQDKGEAKKDKEYSEYRFDPAGKAQASDTIRKRSAGIKMVRNKLKTEEVEQIDEIGDTPAGKKALGSYIKKAKTQMSRSDTVAGRLAGERMVGGKPSAQEKKHSDRANKRYFGIDRAVDRLTREEVEQIDEIGDTPAGKKALGSYINKASRSAADLKAMGSVHSSKTFGIHGGKEKQKAAQRQANIGKAVDRLTKEDIINRTIEKYIPVAEQMTDEERLIERLEGLSESHIHLLLSVFEGLNQDNRTRMLGLVETREGINSMIDFALENRGE